MLTSMLGQLPCKKEELPSAYVHVRAVAMYMHVGAVAMYHAKTHGNSVKESCHLLTCTLGSCRVPAKHMANSGKKRELSPAYKSTLGTVAMCSAKTHDN